MFLTLKGSVYLFKIDFINEFDKFYHALYILIFYHMMVS